MWLLSPLLILTLPYFDVFYFIDSLNKIMKWLWLHVAWWSVPEWKHLQFVHQGCQIRLFFSYCSLLSLCMQSYDERPNTTCVQEHSEWSRLDHEELQIFWISQRSQILLMLIHSPNALDTSFKCKIAGLQFIHIFNEYRLNICHDT